jgi:hypothetical protein
MSVAQAVPPRKRKRSSPDACEAENAPLISSKRRKIDAVQGCEQRCTSNLELSPCKRLFIDISHLSAASLKNLKRFARCGGPSLEDLRGVSPATVRWEDECLYENFSVSATSVLKGHELSRVQLPGPEAVEQVQ